MREIERRELDSEKRDRGRAGKSTFFYRKITKVQIKLSVVGIHVLHKISVILTCSASDALFLHKRIFLLHTTSSPFS